MAKLIKKEARQAAYPTSNAGGPIKPLVAIHTIDGNTREKLSSEPQMLNTTTPLPALWETAL